MDQPDLGFRVEVNDPNLCPFCRSRPATLLCDFVIGHEWKGDTRYNKTRGEHQRVVARDGRMFTCDRPICRECATNTGKMFIDYTEKGRRKGMIDTTDLCPQCKNAPKNPIRVLTEEEAEIERQKMWKRSEGMIRLV
jgi:hypothetical protein